MINRLTRSYVFPCHVNEIKTELITIDVLLGGNTRNEIEASLAVPFARLTE